MSFIRNVNKDSKILTMNAQVQGIPTNQFVPAWKKFIFYDMQLTCESQ